MHTNAIVAAAAACLLTPAVSHAALIGVPIDPAQSSITVQLCVSGPCGSDTSRASGYFIIDVDDVDTLGTITAYDHKVRLDEPINLVVSYGFLGRLTVNMNGFETFNAVPGTPVGPVSILQPGGGFSIPGVPSAQAGLFDYTATGIPCSLLQSQVPPQPCTGNGDLSQQPAGFTTLNGTITSAARVITVVSTINQSVPIDPANPSLGSFTVTGTVRGSIFVPVPPCQGDINSDGVVNVQDLTIFLAQFGTAVPNATGGDLDGDGIVNVFDLTLFLGAFGNVCADH